MRITKAAEIKQEVMHVEDQWNKPGPRAERWTTSIYSDLTNILDKFRDQDQGRLKVYSKRQNAFLCELHKNSSVKSLWTDDGPQQSTFIHYIFFYIYINVTLKLHHVWSHLSCYLNSSYM